MKTNTKDRVTGILTSMGLDKISRLYYGGRGSILSFHRIVEESSKRQRLNNDALEISPAYLRNILQYLTRDYAIVSLDEIPQYLRNKQNKRFVCLTFDDGYRDVYTSAYPILKEMNAPFTVYVATCFPNQNAVLWNYALEDLLLARQHIEVMIDGQRKSWCLQSVDDKFNAFEDLANLFFGADPERRDELCHSIFGAHDMDVGKYVKQLAISWDELATMAQDPLVTLGAHATNHVPLAALSEVDLAREMVDSKRSIEQNTRQSVLHFSYPFGSPGAAGAREFAQARKAGYLTATTTRRGNIFPEHLEHLHALPRIDSGRNRNNLSFIKSQISGLRMLLTGHLKRKVLD